eukprot:IDg15626t1
MLLHKNVPEKFWADTVVTAAYIQNRTTSRGLQSDMNPYSLWYGAKPDLSHLRVFGSKLSRDVIFDERPSTDDIIADPVTPHQEEELEEETSANYNPAEESSNGSPHYIEPLSKEPAQM